MAMLDRPTPKTEPTIDRTDVVVRAALARPARTAAFASRLDGALSAANGRATDAAWTFLHRLGAHRWQEGFETDLERGWRRYRGSRCVICDDPWEGW